MRLKLQYLNHYYCDYIARYIIPKKKRNIYNYGILYLSHCCDRCLCVSRVWLRWKVTHSSTGSQFASYLGNFCFTAPTFISELIVVEL